jgi:hypothetical protein
MRKTTAFLALAAMAASGAAQAQAVETADAPTCAVVGAHVQGKLRPGLLVMDEKANNLGKITKVETSAGGELRVVEYTGDDGVAQSFDIPSISYSGGPVVVRVPVQPTGHCTPKPAPSLLQPLKVGLTLIDFRGVTLGKITKAQTGSDGVLSSVQYAGEDGSLIDANPSDISYAGGPVAALIR